jgi:hypothetical protein
MADEIKKEKQYLVKMPSWFDSVRSLTTLLIVGTYCLVTFMIVDNSLKLLIQGKDIGRDLLLFIIGNFTGAVLGAVIAYHFKKQNENGGGTQK